METDNDMVLSEITLANLEQKLSRQNGHCSVASGKPGFQREDDFRRQTLWKIAAIRPLTKYEAHQLGINWNVLCMEDAESFDMSQLEELTRCPSNMFR